MVHTLENIKDTLLSGKNPIKKSRVYGENTINKYFLLEAVNFKLSNGVVVVIPEGYIWDLASVPRLFWAIIPPDSDAEVAFLIHDYLYENRLFGRKFADQEMLKWSKATNSTNKWSLSNIDNYVRYYVVRWFGLRVWRT
jgi:hypothetical protein